VTRFERVELGAGDGLVAVIGEVALFVADGEAATPLVDAVRDAAASGSPPGSAVAHRLAELIAGGAAASAFGVVAAGENGWVLLLRGPIAATVDPSSGDGGAQRLSGADSITWLDRLLPADTATVLIAPEGAEPPGASPASLEAGVVPGGWLRAVLPPPGERRVTAGTSTITGRAATIPPAPREAGTMAIPVPGASGGASSAPALPSGEPELFALTPEGLTPREPLPIIGVTAGAAEIDGGDVAADADSVDAARTPEAAPDAATVERTTAATAQVAAPSYGVLVFDDGSTFGLDGDYLIGREPETDASVVEGRARPIVLDDPEGTVSRIHAEIRLAGGGVQLIDRGSTNGSHLWEPSKGEWDRLTPDEPRPIRPGDRGAIGQRTFLYERPTTAGPAVEPRAVQTAAVAPVSGVLAGQDGAVHPLDRNYVIGRDPMSDDAVRHAQASPLVVRDDPFVSDIHARVTIDGGAVYVEDVAGSSGTFVAAPGASSWDQVGTSRVALQSGWSMRVGHHVLTYRPAS